MSDNDDHRGRRVLVTGGTRGIGAAITARLAGAGATVLTTARSAPDDGRPAELFVRADVSTAEGAATIVRAAQERLGGVDVIVHNVGASFSKPGGALALDDEDWLMAMRTNVFAAVRIDRALLPDMLERGSGAIVHISSVQWRRPDGSAPAYAAAKAALMNYSKGLATELAGRGIRVNAVTPGFIETSGAKAQIQRRAEAAGVDTETARAQVLAAIGGVPMNRPGTPEEVAELVAFLTSDRAGYLSGGEYAVDGGNNRVI